MEALHGAIFWLNGIVWGPPMLILLFGTHLYLTFRLKFIQKYVFKAIKLSVTKDDSGAGDISQFGALATALAATMHAAPATNAFCRRTCRCRALVR